MFTNALTKDYNPVRSKARLKKSVHRIMRVINRLLIFDVISFLRHRRPNCGGFPIGSAVSFPLIKSACRKPILSFVRWSLTKRQASGTAPRGPRDVSRWLLFEIASHQSGTAGAYADVFPSNQPFRSVICRRLHSDSDRGVYTKQPPPLKRRSNSDRASLLP